MLWVLFRLLVIVNACMVMGTCAHQVSLWMLVLTLGEVVWSPRSASYAASMAPVGREGIFLMMSSWPTYLTK
jgi:hypothetical protein